MFKTNLKSCETETAALKETIIKLEKEVAEAKSEIEVHSHMMEENEHKSIDEAARLNKAIEDLQKDKESQAVLIEDFKGIHSQNQSEIGDLKKKIEVEMKALTSEL